MRKNLQLLLLPFLAIISSVYAQDTTTTSSPLTIDDTIFPFVDNDAAQEYKILSSSQADYIISVLRGCKEIVLYCGHEDEVETYMVFYAIPGNRRWSIMRRQPFTTPYLILVEQL